MISLHKYPRTPHIEGSRLQPGDEDLASVPFRTLAGRYLVVEEKLDGANTGLSFDEAGRLRLQSRGHYLDGGPREKHFNLFKQWAASHQAALWKVLGERYVVYGEWLYAKHTVFYDGLPHYFLEFDVLEKATGIFLATDRRRALLRDLPLAPVPVLWEGQAGSLTALLAQLGPSRFKTTRWHAALRQVCRARDLDAELVARETDPSDLMEGLYLKVEERGRVVVRYKYVRADFLATVQDSGMHWLNRPIVPNQLADGVDLFTGGSAEADGASARRR